MTVPFNATSSIRDRNLSTKGPSYSFTIVIVSHPCDTLRALTFTEPRDLYTLTLKVVPYYDTAGRIVSFEPNRTEGHFPISTYVHTSSPMPFPCLIHKYGLKESS